jgi:hypothetical protein
MTKIFILITLTACATRSFAQGELQGTWILESFTVDSGQPIEITRLEAVKITFDEDGRYIKTYHQEELPDGAQVHMTYTLPDKKFTRKYLDKDGYEIKVVRVKKKTDNGTYEKVNPNELRFSTANGSYTKMFKVDGQHLSIADTLQSRVIWSRYKKRS